MNFTEMNLDADILHALRGMSITVPTEVQALAVPPGLAGRDILATSQTGTGKTLAFLIPLFTKLRADSGVNALILAPTRELASQIFQTAVNMWAPANRLSAALLIGGADMQKQLHTLKQNPRIIIATPGRTIDHLKRKTVSLKNTAFVVLDETDRMLDMGFVNDINTIFAFLPKERQTFMFSATLPPSIQKLAQAYLKTPARITVGETHKAHALIEQNHIKVAVKEKFETLVKELNARKGTKLVFVKTKHLADRMAKRLNAQNINSASLHGDLKQNKRVAVMDKFRHGKLDVLVATDLAARGLDVSHVENVINYDVPYTPEEYIHRVGRTGRAGKEGSAVTFVTDEDNKKWKAVCNLLAGKSYAGAERRSNRVIKQMDAFVAPAAADFFKKDLERTAAKKKVNTSPSRKGGVKSFDFLADARGGGSAVKKNKKKKRFFNNASGRKPSSRPAKRK